MDETPPRALAAPAAPAAIVFAVLAALAFLSARGALPERVLPFAAAPVLFLGAGFPVLLRWSPLEPSLLKLALLSSLASPALLALGYAALRPFASSADAFAWTLFSAAPLQALALGRRLGREPLGKPAWCVLGFALALAGAVAWFLLGAGNALRLGGDASLWHTGVAGAIDRGWPAENPWLAGTPVPALVSYDVLGLVVSRALLVPPPRAFAVLNVWVALLLPLALYLWAAPLYREPRRALLAPLLALLAWDAGAGLAALLGAGPVLATGALSAPFVGAGYLLRPGAPAVALAFAAGAWMAGAHALRHGARPWVGLCALLHGAALWIAPALGAAAALGTVATGLLRPGPGSQVATLVLACALPAFADVMAVGPLTEPQSDVPGHAGPSSALLLGACTLGLLRTAWLRSLRGEHARGAGTVALQLACTSAVALLLFLDLGPLSRYRGDVWHVATLPLGLLAAGGLVNLLTAKIPQRVLGSALVLVLGAGSAVAHFHVARAHLALRREHLPVSERGRALDVVPGGSRRFDPDIAAAYRWLCDDAPVKDPVLIRSASLSDDSFGLAHVPHSAPIFSGLPLWCEWRKAFAGDAERFGARKREIERLYRDRTFQQPSLEWNPYLTSELQRTSRAAVFLVEQLDRETSGGAIEYRLQQLGCRLARRFGDVAVFTWVPAATAVSAPR